MYLEYIIIFCIYAGDWKLCQICIDPRGIFMSYSCEIFATWLVSNCAAFSSREGRIDPIGRYRAQPFTKLQVCRDVLSKQIRKIKDCASQALR